MAIDTPENLENKNKREKYNFSNSRRSKENMKCLQETVTEISEVEIDKKIMKMERNNIQLVLLTKLI